VAGYGSGYGGGSGSTRGGHGTGGGGYGGNRSSYGGANNKSGGSYGGSRGGGAGGTKPAVEGFDASRPYTSRVESCGNYAMRFGKYKDATLGQLADDDEALLYLDWLRSKEDFTGLSRDYVTIFLHQPAIAERLDAAIQAKRAERETPR
jgi:hypothetical protein